MNLHPFPGTTCSAAHDLTATIARQATGLQLTYHLTGDLGALMIPEQAIQPAVTPGLWQHTCFELFYKAPDAEAYDEYNFSPSLNWDHYRFNAYRQPVANAAKIAPALAVVAHDDSQFVLEALVSLPPSPTLLAVSLTAVIEAADGSKTYWALHHPGYKPDFHAPDGFTLRL